MGVGSVAVQWKRDKLFLIYVSITSTVRMFQDYLGRRLVVSAQVMLGHTHAQCGR